MNAIGDLAAKLAAQNTSDAVIVSNVSSSVAIVVPKGLRRANWDGPHIFVLTYLAKTKTFGRS